MKRSFKSLKAQTTTTFYCATRMHSDNITYTRSVDVIEFPTMTQYTRILYYRGWIPNV